MRRLVSAIVIAGLFASACGKSAEQKAAEQAAEDLKKATEAMAEAAAKQGTAAAAQGTADMAKAMQGMAAAFSGNGADGKPVNPVSFQTLQTQLAEGVGLGDARTARRAHDDADAVTRRVEADYRKGDASVDVKIMDTGMAPMLVAPWSMMLATGYSKETTDGYEKATTIGGNPAVEKWDSRDKRGELNILVGKRFMVIDRRPPICRDIKDVKAFTSAMDFGAIAALK